MFFAGRAVCPFFNGDSRHTIHCYAGVGVRLCLRFSRDELKQAHKAAYCCTFNYASCPSALAVPDDDALDSPDSPIREPTLCWTCERAAGKNMCSWARNFVPVPGWDAEPTIIYNSDGPIDSYLVKGCPEFIRERERGRRGGGSNG